MLHKEYLPQPLAGTKVQKVDGASFEELSHYPPLGSYSEPAAPAHPHSGKLQLLPLCAWLCMSGPEMGSNVALRPWLRGPADLQGSSMS